MEELARIAVVMALIGVNAFFVIGEYAVVTARRSALSALAGGGSRGGAAALRLMDDPVRVISTVQVGITAVGILIGALGEPLVRELLGDQLPGWAGFIIAFAAVTYLTVVLGELVPKAITLDRAETLATLVAPPIELIGRVLRPAVTLLEGSAKAVLRPFGVTEVVAGESIRSPEELRALVDEAEGAGIIPTAQEELIYNVFDFAAKEAADVMVPAADVAWVDAALSPSAALTHFAESRHDRLPVGEGSLDRLVGILHVHDLIAAIDEGDDERPVRELMRQARIVPGTKDLGALLREMREHREHVVVVVSEYGTTSGLVSLTDILEEIVGEIESEYELPESRVTRLEDGSIDAAGSISVDDLNEALGTSFPTDGARTLAGLVFESLGRAAEPSDEVRIGDITLAVRVVDGARITRINVRGARPDGQEG
jgi:putative hemolysin